MSLLQNQAVADALAVMFADPLQHPGNPETKQQPAAIVVPQFRVAHQPPPYTDAIRAQNQTIAEVVVYHIENALGQTIAPTEEWDRLRAERDQAVAAAQEFAAATTTVLLGGDTAADSPPEGQLE